MAHLPALAKFRTAASPSLQLRSYITAIQFARAHWASLLAHILYEVIMTPSIAAISSRVHASSLSPSSDHSLSLGHVRLQLTSDGYNVTPLKVNRADVWTRLLKDEACTMHILQMLANMLLHTSAILAACLGTALAFPQAEMNFHIDDYETNQVTWYINKMTPISRKNLLLNTGAAVGADPGVVTVADIPKIDPSIAPFYNYQYVRDAGQAYNMWIKHFAARLDTSLRPLLDDCVHASLETQHVTSPSGNVFTGGLVEPKLFPSLLPDLSPMARPQNDGPAIRSIFLLDYAHWLLDHNNGTWVADNLWRAIHIDLLWIGLHWNETSFELWETVNTKSYWTASLQYHALRDGSDLAQRINRTLDVEFFGSQANLLLDFMQSFWDEEQGYMHANSAPGRNVDSATIHASVHNYDPAAGCDAATLQPCSDRALSNLKVIVERFKGLYPIAQGIPANKGSPLGMFYEDTTNGGQPWFFSVFACAEQLYYAVNTWDALGGLNVTTVSQPFFAIFKSDIQPGSYNKKSAEYRQLWPAIRSYADSYIALAANYTPKSGVLYDGFNKTDGSPVGAPGLSWSYAGALMAFSARGGLKPRSWGALPSSSSQGQQNVNEDISYTNIDASQFNVQSMRFRGLEQLQLAEGSDYSRRPAGRAAFIDKAL